MITLVEAKGYRCLRYVRQPLDEFHVLVGPNASGKTTFLDVISFLGRLVSDGPEAAVTERTENLYDLFWQRQSSRFELAIEARIPDERRDRLATTRFDTIRYEVAIGLTDDGELGILAEKALLKPGANRGTHQRQLFPQPPSAPTTILSPIATGARTVLNKVPHGNDNFHSEVAERGGKGWIPTFKLGPRRSTLGNLPADESRFPVATWLRDLLSEGVQQVVLNSLLIRRASPPAQPVGLRPDGSNIPWVIERLRTTHPERFRDWIGHLRTALPDIETIRTVEREEDRHRYLVIRYGTGLDVPSWMASDGTLRLLALTLPTYLEDFTGSYLIEEPENGIHPLAVETVVHSLSNVYQAQVLVATHSTVILSVIDPAQVLCFAKTEDGATDIVSGSDHPALREWRGEANLGVLFAAGVLG